MAGRGKGNRLRSRICLNLAARDGEESENETSRE